MKAWIQNNWRQAARDLLITAAALTGAALLCVLLRRMDQGDIYVSMIFLLAVTVVARFTSGPALWHHRVGDRRHGRQLRVYRAVL